jgi:hypothetical protein
MGMSTADKVVMIVCIFGGFLWLRTRARTVHAERRQGPVMLGIFLVLPALLILESRLFAKLSYGPATNVLIKAAVLVSTFAAVGFGFLRPAPAGARDSDRPGDDASEPEGRDPS